MKTPICMPTYKRIPYLKQVLEALVKCHGVENFQLVTSEEPEQETRTFLDAFLPTLGLEISRHQNANLLGGNANICKSLRQGFAMGADWVVYLEDDIILAKDALRFLEWAVMTHLGDPLIVVREKALPLPRNNWLRRALVTKSFHRGVRHCIGLPMNVFFRY